MHSNGACLHAGQAARHYGRGCAARSCWRPPKSSARVYLPRPSPMYDSEDDDDNTPPPRLSAPTPHRPHAARREKTLRQPFLWSVLPRERKIPAGFSVVCAATAGGPLHPRRAPGGGFAAPPPMLNLEG